MEYFAVSLLNGLSFGLLLFMLSSGLTLIFSMMGVLNFAHASFYMLGAYIGYSVSEVAGFWPGLLIAPLVVGGLGALFQRFLLRRVHAFGHVPELLITFGLSYLIVEVVQLIWGRSAVDYRKPPELDFAAFSIYGTQFPAYRLFLMGVALAMLACLSLVLKKSRLGLIIQAALTHPQTLEALGHNVPRVFMLVFGGGAALAGLAGAVGGAQFVTEPAMAATVGSIVFVVVVVGGLGSVRGAFVASMLIGLLDAFAAGSDRSLADVVHWLGLASEPAGVAEMVLRVRFSQVAAMLPYLLLVLVLVFRPRGLFGVREG
jgi:branched-chain amino acid transport system permease protein